MDDEPILQTFNLSKRYKKRWAVRDLNLIVRRGEVFGFLGPNGAGKSTTIRMILSLVKPTAGRVELFGKEVRTSSLSSYLKARQIAEALAERIESGEFLLTEPVAPLPADKGVGTLEVRSKEEAV